VTVREVEEHASPAADLPISLPIDFRWQTPACDVADGIARIVCAAQRLGAEFPAPFFAKVRVAGSNPVVRSSHTGADQSLLAGDQVAAVSFAHELPMACP
jgi:hypothetical protein